MLFVSISNAAPPIIRVGFGGFLMTKFSIMRTAALAALAAAAGIGVADKAQVDINRMIAATFDIAIPAALEMLRRHAIAHRMGLTKLATMIVEGALDPAELAG